jgi:cytochrome bd-type quinol oxidase subunit 1
MTLARRWSQAMGVLVAVGAVTGTVLSFEMGLLWPGLMRQYGAVLGLPFGIEGLFFFLEAIFTAIYLYGWRRLDGWAHFWTGAPIALSGILGAMSVVAVNSWMNLPGGFTALRSRRQTGAEAVAGLVHQLTRLPDVRADECPVAFDDVASDDHGFHVGWSGAEDHRGHDIAESVQVG